MAVEDEIHLRDYLAIVLKFRILIISGAAAGLLLGLVVTTLSSPVYSSTAKLLVTDRQSNAQGQSVGEAYSGILMSERLAKTYSQMATRPSLLKKAARAAKIPGAEDGLKDLVTAVPVRDTQLLEITAQSSSPEVASALANTIGELLADEVEQLDRAIDGSKSQASVKLSIIEPAVPSQKPVSPKPLANMLLALVGGVLISALIAFVIDHLDTTIKDNEDVQKVFGGLPILAQIPVEGDTRAERLIVKSASASVSAESFRSLRTNLGFLNYEGSLRTILITSAKPGEGKTTVIANLGAALAQAGHKVLLIGADMRRPRIHEAVSVKSTKGLSSVLIGASYLSDVIVQTNVTNLSILTSGPIPPNPAELLGSKRMEALLREAGEQFDYVLIDTPPVLAVTDPMVLAGLVDGVIMVVRSGVTQFEAAKRFVLEMRQSKGRPVGVVLNGANLREGYGYYDYSQHDEAPAKKKRFSLSIPSLFGIGAGAATIGFIIVSLIVRSS